MRRQLNLKIVTALLSLATFTTFYLTQPATAHAQGTAFTYQGRLNDGVNPANGSYDLTFALFSVSSGAGQIGSTVTNAVTSVSNGLFTVPLDFGDQFPGADRWLEIGVRTNGGGAFALLLPRQPLTATPYAVRAANFSGAVAAGQLPVSIARLDGSQIFAGPNRFTNSANTFSGSGAGLTEVRLASLDGEGMLSLPQDHHFRLASSPGVGLDPSSVAVTDVNGDNWPDLISANSGQKSLTVLTNDGSGGFALASSPNVELNPISVTAADVNGDGRSDLISANYGANTLTVLTNDGSGGFAVASSPAVGLNPISVTTADVNNDGWPDLINANRNEPNTVNADTLSVLTNDGSGGFVLASSPAVGWNPRCVTTADVNGDGSPDLISGNQVPFTLNYALSVWTNNGSGGFAPASQPGVGDGPSSVTATDVNGDGRPDLISANTSFLNAVTVLTNDGSGGFVLASTPAVGFGQRSVTATDVNGDGRPDLISAYSASISGNYTLNVLLNTGGGQFAYDASPGVGPNPNFVTAADINGDGRPDLISANSGDDTLSVLFNAPSIRFDTRVTFGDAASFVGSKTLEFGAGVAGKERDAGQIGYQRFTPDALDFVGAGTNSTTRKIKFWAEGGATFTGPVSGTVFNPTSDRHAKNGFTPVNSGEVLAKVAALPITRWHFNSEPGAAHVGPMAQDFHAAFALGTDDKHIATVDADGVALAAIQGLNEKVEAGSQKSEARSRMLEERLQQKETEIAELQKRLAALEKIIRDQ